MYLLFSLFKSFIKTIQNEAKEEKNQQKTERIPKGITKHQGNDALLPTFLRLFAKEMKAKMASFFPLKFIENWQHNKR